MLKTHNIYFYVTLLFVAFPLLGQKIVPLLIALWFITILILRVKNHQSNPLPNINNLFIQSSLFIVILIWTLIIDNTKEGYFLLERSLSLIIFPIGFYLNPIQLTNKQLNIVKLTFICSSTIIVLVSSILAFNKLLVFVGENQPFKNLFDFINRTEFEYHFRTNFEDFSGLHPTYASMYLGLSILFLIEMFFNSDTFITLKKKLIIILSSILLLTLMAALASRTPLLGILMVSALYVFVKIKKKIYAFYVLLSLLVLSIALISTVPTLSKRFSEISLNNTSVPIKKGDDDSFNLRAGILHCTINLIKENWLIGVGPGKVQNKLDECYNTIAPETYRDREFNTHNQFLGYWAGMGIIGIVTLIFVLFATAIKGFSTKNIALPFVCLFFTICFLTENVLIRQQGVVFVAFFLNFFYFEKNILHKHLTSKP